MEEEKKYSKVKIFLFLIFAVMSIVLITELSKFMSLGTEKINMEKKELFCGSLNFKIEDVSYKSNLLVFQFSSNDYNLNISSITVVDDIGLKEHTSAVDPPLGGGDYKIVSIPDIVLNRSFSIYINDCNKINSRKQIGI